MRTYFVHWKTFAEAGNYSEGTFTFDTWMKGKEAVEEAYEKAREAAAGRPGHGLVLTHISLV